MSSPCAWRVCSQIILFSTRWVRDALSISLETRTLRREELLQLSGGGGTSLAVRVLCHLLRPHPSAGSQVELWALPPPFIHFHFCVVMICTQRLHDRSHTWSPYYTSPPRSLKGVKFYRITLLDYSVVFLTIYNPLWVRFLCRTPLKGATCCQAIHCSLNP